MFSRGFCRTNVSHADFLGDFAGYQSLGHILLWILFRLPEPVFLFLPLFLFVRLWDPFLTAGNWVRHRLEKPLRL